MSRFLIDLAVSILPPHRRDWGEAMRAEFAAIPNPREAFGFALGCLWAALSERITVMKLITAIGRIGVGLVTLAYSSVFLMGAFNLWLHPGGGAVFGNNIPVLMTWILAMGFTHAFAGFFLIRWRPKLFAVFCALAVLPAVGLTLAGGVLNHWHNAASYTWPFIPLTLLVAAAVFLDWLDREPAKPNSPLPFRGEAG
jgi:hypothetical protein